MARNTVPPELGLPVTWRSFSFKDMAIRAWGSEYSAPDHGVYEWSNGRRFDSTDRGTTGIYRQGTTTTSRNWSADSTFVTADSTFYTADAT
jgi:hypothetical protein